MSLRYLYAQHEAQQVAPPAWRHYTSDAKLSHSHVIAFPKLPAFPQAGGGSRSVWLSTSLAIDLFIHCEHKNSPPPISTLTGAPLTSLCDQSPFCRLLAQLLLLSVGTISPPSIICSPRLQLCAPASCLPHHSWAASRPAPHTSDTVY